MKIEELTKAGALLEKAKELKTITWVSSSDGVEHTGEVTIKVLSFGVVENMVKFALEQGTTASVALLIAATEFDGEQLTVELAEALDPNFAKALVDAINEVNPTKKPTPAPTN